MRCSTGPDEGGGRIELVVNRLQLVDGVAQRNFLITGACGFLGGERPVNHGYHREGIGESPENG